MSYVANSLILIVRLVFAYILMYFTIAARNDLNRNVIDDISVKEE